MKPFARMTCQAVALRRLILVSFLALAGAGCVYTDGSPDTNNVNEAEWGCLDELSENVFEPDNRETRKEMQE